MVKLLGRDLESVHYPLPRTTAEGTIGAAIKRFQAEYQAVTYRPIINKVVKSTLLTALALPIPYRSGFCKPNNATKGVRHRE